MFSRPFRSTVSIGLTAGLLGVPVSRAQAVPGTPASASASAPRAAVDPAARGLLLKMEDAYKKLKSYSVTVHLTGRDGDEAVNVQGTVAFQRPGRAAVTIRKNGTALKAVANGTWLHLVNGKRYQKKPAPAGFAAVQEAMQEGGLDNSFLMAILTEDDMLAGLLGDGSGVVSLKRESSPPLNGVAVDKVVIRARHDESDTGVITFLIGKTDRLLRSVLVSWTGEEGKVTLAETHTKVKANPALPPSTFAFTPPRDAGPVPPVPAGEPPGGASP